ncbi:hypothetical protein [Spirosoma sp.]|uniref:hypothetical protein n=1 Tax=Spirosoma sp. TaxID=1899569 RepID=UPI0026370B29|nr:hypothetical protein [Spirosoma sp.]MCX6217660.1 hypothetical protein [Spirosoma sp.]
MSQKIKSPVTYGQAIGVKIAYGIEVGICDKSWKTVADNLIDQNDEPIKCYTIMAEQQAEKVRSSIVSSGKLDEANKRLDELIKERIKPIPDAKLSA